MGGEDASAATFPVLTGCGMVIGDVQRRDSQRTDD
jgi:hypothetical protein